MDGTTFHSNSTGYGKCFRNLEGHCLTGKSANLYSYVFVLEAEAITLLEAISTNISSGFHDVMFETNKSLADAINSSSTFHNTFDRMILQGMDLLATNSDFVVFLFNDKQIKLNIA